VWPVLQFTNPRHVTTTRPDIADVNHSMNTLVSMGHWGTCPRDFLQLFGFSPHFRAAAQTLKFDFMCMVACPERIIMHAYSFETVYCMNFIIFLCLILKLFSPSFVRLLVPTSDLSFNCFRQQLKTFLFCKYWHQSQYYFSALETSFMRSTNLWYLLTYLHKHDTSLSGGTQSQTTQIGTTQVRASPRSACQIQRQTDSHDVSDDDDDTDNSL